RARAPHRGVGVQLLTTAWPACAGGRLLNGGERRAWRLDTVGILGEHLVGSPTRRSRRSRQMRGVTIGPRVSAVATALAGLAVVGLAQAAEVRVISAGAVRSIVSELAQAYEKET